MPIDLCSQAPSAIPAHITTSFAWSEGDEAIQGEPGIPVEKAVNIDSMGNPEAIDYFVRMAKDLNCNDV